MEQPIFRRGQSVIHLITGKEIIIKRPNFDRLLIKNNSGHSTGFSDEFNGSYFCSWLNDKDKWEEGDIEENLLSKPLNTIM